jgi:hypothetical protein
MNDLSETITSFLTIRDILRDSNGDKKLVDAAIVLFEHYIDVHDRAFVKAWNTVIKEPNTMPPWGHSDMEALRYTDDELDSMCDAAELAELQDKYNDLKMEHEALQCLFVQEEYDHDELKVEYDKVQKDYHTVVTNVLNNKYDCD